MGKILGIDLGTTNSAFAVTEGGEPEILENEEGNRTTPSIVAISKNGERLVGQTAKRQAVTNAENTIFGIKRFIGHRFSDEAVQKDKDIVPYTVKEGEDESVLIEMGDDEYRPEEISAMILQKIKQDAEAKLGEEVEEAVITVPAYFNDSQRKATKDAGTIAGFDVKRIINEPTAAALAYGFDKKSDQQIVVFDYGGGTFDISVLEIGDDVVEVKSTGGNSHMGGKDIDQEIIDWIIQSFKEDSGIDLSDDKLALQRLDEAAENAKHELSSKKETEINIPFITSDEEGPEHLQLTLTRAKLEEMAKEYIDRALDITEDVVNESPFDRSDIDEVILVGGQTRMPAIQEAVANFFDTEPNKSINPDEVVALGAAVQGGIMQGDVQDVLLLDVTPLSLGIETQGGVMTELIEKNTTIPTQASQTFSTAANNQTSVEIHVLQGERAMANDNKSLGRFILDGIPPAPRGVPQIDVTFEIDADGILNVSAEDQNTGKEQSIRIEATSGLSEEEIEEMQEEAEKHAEEDEKKRELAQARNQAEQLVYTAQDALEENEDSIPDDVQEDVQEKITAVEEVQESDDIDEIHDATEELSEAMQQIGQAMGGQAGQAGAGPHSGAQTAGAATEEPQAGEGYTATDTSNEQQDDKDVRDAEVTDEDEEDDE